MQCGAHMCCAWHLHVSLYHAQQPLGVWPVLHTSAVEGQVKKKKKKEDKQCTVTVVACPCCIEAGGQVERDRALTDLKKKTKKK